MLDDGKGRLFEVALRACIAFAVSRICATAFEHNRCNGSKQGQKASCYKFGSHYWKSLASCVMDVNIDEASKAEK